jgi:imidazole glycerol-phosphate synthase subunit HisH
MIAIIDYGLGNVKAFATVYKKLNIPVLIATEAKDLLHSDRIILPGVGAFDYAMQRLDKSGMRNLLTDLVTKNSVPVLGVCVGMQMLANSSEEGILPGLGWIDGTVKLFDRGSMCVPHMGWNNIKPVKENKLLEGFNEDSHFYFLHSYYLKCKNDEDTISVTDYYKEFTSAANSGNVYGVQFHPEKSHEWGIMLLENFAKL